MSDLIRTLKAIRPEADFSESSNFIEEGLLDSFDLILLVSALDKNFGISIQGTDIVPENFRNVQTIEALLRKKGARL
jgi:acyl carrier protein